LEPVLFQSGLNHVHAVQNSAIFGLAAFTAAQARSCQQVIQRDPIPPGHPELPEDPAHANVIGDKTGSIRKKLSAFAVWVIAPAFPTLA